MLLYIAPVFLPLIGAAITGLFGRVLGDRPSQYISCGAMGLAALASIFVFNNVVMQGEVQQIYLFNWMSAGTFVVDWALRIDELTAMMVFTVSIVSFLIHVYSIGYMAHDPHIPRFFAYLSLFTFLISLIAKGSRIPLWQV